jgi:hypothetical protein
MPRPKAELLRLKSELTSLVLPPTAIAAEWYEDDSQWADRLYAELERGGFKLLQGLSPKLCVVGLRCLNWCTVGEGPSRPIAFARALREFAAHPMRRALLPRPE